MAAIREAAEVKAAGIRPERVRASEGTVVYVHRPPATGSSAETIAREVEALLAAAIVAMAWAIGRFGCPRCGKDPTVPLGGSKADVLLNPEFCCRCGVRLRPPPRTAAWSDIDDAGAVARFRLRRILRVVAPIVLAILSLPISAAATWKPLVMVAFGVFVGGSVLVWFWSLTCPRCHGLVNSSRTRDLSPPRCPHCGVMLR